MDADPLGAPVNRDRGDRERETGAGTEERGTGKRTDRRDRDGSLVELESERLAAAHEDDHDQ